MLTIFLFLAFILIAIVGSAVAFKVGFFAGCYEVLKRAEPLNEIIDKHGNQFIKQEWELYLKKVAPEKVDSDLISHLKRSMKKQPVRE